MGRVCGDADFDRPPDDPTRPPEAAWCGKKPAAGADGPIAWFREMIPHCLAYAEEARKEGRPVVGILCEYTPRELILAAGGVPVMRDGQQVSTWTWKFRMTCPSCQSSTALKYY